MTDPPRGSNYSTVVMSAAHRDAIAACGNESGTVTVVKDGVEGIDSSTQFVSIDEVRGEVVVSTHATNPLDYAVGIAVALAHPKLIEQALDEQTLATVLDDAPGGVLRRARQVGYLTDEVLADAGEVQEMLIGWGEDIEELTRRLRRYQYGNGEYDDRSDLMSQIVRDSLGLAGSVVHLLDEVGIEIIRDIRVPRSAKIEALAESITQSVAIQSQYKDFSAYRQLFESRPEYRARAETVEVDAADPSGNLIGSMVIRGESAVRLEPVLERRLAELESHEDAPEFCVPVVMRGVTRENVAAAASRVSERKNLRMTETAVSVLDAIVDSPFHVTRALEQLDRNPEPRDIKSVDLRQALRRLSADDMLSDLPRSVGKIVSVLIDTREPISQSELADRAGITGQTVRNRADGLITTGFVQYEEKASGKKEWRVALSFGHESDQDVFPALCTQSLESVVDITGECNCADEAPAGTYSEDFVGLNGCCLLSEWEQVSAALTNSSELCERTTKVLLGSEVKQISIHDVGQADGVEEPSRSDQEMDHRDAEDVSGGVRTDGDSGGDGEHLCGCNGDGEHRCGCNGDGEKHRCNGSDETEQQYDEIDLSGVSIAGADDRYKPDHPDSGEEGS